MKKQGKLIKILCATLILLMLSGCSASISDTQTSELVHIANGIYWLSDSEYMIDRIFDEYGKPINVYATGGLASSIVSNCKHNITLDADMVLKGLYIIYKNNK